MLIARADRALLEAKRARGRGTGRRNGETPAPVAIQRERQRLRRLATAGSVGTRLARLLDQRAIAETAIVELGAALGYESCALGADAARTGRSEAVAATGGDAAYGARPDVSPALARSLRERRTVLETDVRGSLGTCSELAVPVYVGGELWGALAVRSGPGAPFGDDDAQLVQTVADHLGTALRTAELYEQLDQTHLGTAEALAAALEAKDTYTADHARSIADLAVAVGRALGLDDEGLRDLRYGAIFHDIGKIAIPDAILNKPGPLTRGRARRWCAAHPEVGEQILAPVPFLAGVRRIVRHDHERWDGNGLPRRPPRRRDPARRPHRARRRRLPRDDAPTVRTGGRCRPRRRAPSCAGTPARSSIPSVVDALLDVLAVAA